MMVWFALFGVTQALPAQVSPAQISQERYARLARGVNLTRWFQYGSYLPVTAADRDLLKQEGFSSVRIAVAPQYLLPKWASAEKIARNLADLDAGIDMFLHSGMAVMLDFQADVPYLDYYLSTPSAPAELIDTWRMLATRYADRDPNLLFFEIMNEPDGRFTQAAWDLEQKAVLAAIRKVAPAHTVLLAPVGWSGLDSLLRMTPYKEPNVVYVLHYYQPMQFTHQGADWTGNPEIASLRGIPWPPDDEWDADRIDWDMHLAAEWARQWNVSLVVNEFGAYKPFSPPDSRARWMRDVRMAIERHHLGWAMWDYGAGFDLTLVSDTGVRSIDPAMSAALGLQPWKLADPAPRESLSRFGGVRTVQIGEVADAASAERALRAIDVNVDGSTDVVMTSAGGPVEFFLNSGDGIMRAGKFEGPAPVLISGASIVPGNFDRSGRPGFFFPEPDGKSRLVMPYGASALREADAGLPAGITGAVASDVDGDGVDDLIVFGPVSGPVSGGAPQLYRNDGTGHFRLDPDAFPPGAVSAGGRPVSCGVFRGSRLVTNGFVFSNDGRGRFALVRMLPVPEDAGSCSALADGAVVLIAWEHDMLQIITDAGDQLLHLPPSKKGIRAIAMGGRTVVLTRGGDSPLVLSDDGSGVFTDSGVRLPDYPWLVAPGDFNRDGVTDLIFGQGGGAPLVARPGRF